MASAHHQNGLVLGTTAGYGSFFDELPVELVKEIVSHLAPDDLVAFASTQHFLSEVCQDALEEHQVNLEHYAYIYIGEHDEAGSHFLNESAIWYRHPMYLLSDLVKMPYIAYYVRTIVWNHSSAREEYERMMEEDEHSRGKATKQEIMDIRAKSIILDSHNQFADLLRELLVDADRAFQDLCTKRMKIEDPQLCLWLILLMTKNIERLRALREVGCDDWVELVAGSKCQPLSKLRSVELWERSEFKIPARRFQDWLKLPNLEHLSGDRLTQGWHSPAIELSLATSSLTCLELTSSEVQGSSVAKMLTGLNHLQSFSYVMSEEGIMDPSTWDVSAVVKALVKYCKHTLTKLLLRLEIPAPRKICPDLCELEALKHYVGPVSLIPHTYASKEKLLTVDLQPAFASTLTKLHLTNTHVWCDNYKTYTGNDEALRKHIKINNAQCFPSLRQVRFFDADLFASSAKGLKDLGIKFTASDPVRDRVGGEIQYSEDSDEEEGDAFAYLEPSGVPEYFMGDGDSDDEEVSSGDDSDKGDKS